MQVWSNEMETLIIHGDIIYSEDKDNLSVHADSYIVVKNGFVDGIYDRLPDEYAGISVKDCKSGVIIPAFSDLHTHVSQFAQRGIGMDKLLFDWLSDYTFPQESNFASMDYAQIVYDQVIQDMIRHGTFHASLFTTIHYDACDYLFSKLENMGFYAYTGKVNMDQNSPDFLCETTEKSLYKTEKFLADHQGGKTVKPILTPRFAPTCSERLLNGLGKLGQKYHCGMQTHLVESKAEKAKALELFPDCRSDAEIYQKAGLLENGPTVFAHFIFPSENDKDIVRRSKAVTVHCPDSTTNITAGIMPVNTLQKEGILISLGTDMGGGQGSAVYREVAKAVQLSKLKEYFEPDDNCRISFARAFYMATAVGGSIFDRVGSLKKGYRFNAVVIDNLEDKGFTLTPEEKLERFCYSGDDRNITDRYLNGQPIFIS